MLVRHYEFSFEKCSSKYHFNYEDFFTKFFDFTRMYVRIKLPDYR